jgi:hypothetical protein
VIDSRIVHAPGQLGDLDDQAALHGDVAVTALAPGPRQVVDGPPRGAGFTLYPHFYPTLTPGWFDKPFGSRRHSAEDLDDLLLITPTPGFVASLPGAKIPDRKDPGRLGPRVCRKTWTGVGEASQRLGEALETVLDEDRIPELIGA